MCGLFNQSAIRVADASPIWEMGRTLAQVVGGQKIGTDPVLLLFLWMLVSGYGCLTQRNPK